VGKLCCVAATKYPSSPRIARRWRRPWLLFTVCCRPGGAAFFAGKIGMQGASGGEPDYTPEKGKMAGKEKMLAI